MYTVEFEKHSNMSREEKNKIGFMKIKRLSLRLLRYKSFYERFGYYEDKSTLKFAIKYFDAENEINSLTTYSAGHFRKKRTNEQILTDILSSIYQNSPSKFQTFFGFLLKETRSLLDHDFHYYTGWSLIAEELRNLGFEWDGEILKRISGESKSEQKVTTIIEEQLAMIDPALVEARKGAIERLLSNDADKVRHVAASSRALINQLMQKLVPELTEVEIEDGKIKSRIKKILKSGTESELVAKTIGFIQTLNAAQAKGDHATGDEDLAYLIFEMTDKIVYFLLIKNK